MRQKYYQFHFAEISDGVTHNVGILNYQSAGSATKDDLIKYARQYLRQPEARIFISHITKLTIKEYEQLTGRYQQTGERLRKNILSLFVSLVPSSKSIRAIH